MWEPPPYADMNEIATASTQIASIIPSSSQVYFFFFAAGSNLRVVCWGCFLLGLALGFLAAQRERKDRRSQRRYVTYNQNVYYKYKNIFVNIEQLLPINNGLTLIQS